MQPIYESLPNNDIEVLLFMGINSNAIGVDHVYDIKEFTS
jgi:hypothetical protein